MSEHFNGLTPAEAERLAILIEECAETQQAATKILRHGYNNYHPVSKQENRINLETEIGHLHASIALLAANADISMAAVEKAMNEKIVDGIKYLHHQGTTT